MQLRNYQHEAITDIGVALRNARRHRIVFALPTGGGKTVVMAAIASRFAAANKSTVIIAHRRNLVRQLRAAVGENPHIRIAGVLEYRSRPTKAHALMIDEAHHAVARTYKTAIEASEARVVIGVTATPERADGRGLDEVFDDVVIGKTMASLISAGYLANYRYFAPAHLHDPLCDKLARKGEFTLLERQSAASVKKRYGDAVGEYRKHLDGYRAIVFCYDVRDANNMADRFNEEGIAAAAVSGDIGDAAYKHIDDFRADKIKILTSCDLISEGFDVPEARGVIMARATQSTTVFLQQCGRCLRAKSDGGDAIIIDMVGNALRHGLPDDNRQWSIVGAKKRPRINENNVTWRRCPACYHASPRADKHCKECGHEFIPEAVIADDPDASISELDVHAIARIRELAAKKKKERAREMRYHKGHARSLEALRKIEKQMGYKPGWAWRVFMARAKKGEPPRPSQALDRFEVRDYGR